MTEKVAQSITPCKTARGLIDAMPPESFADKVSRNDWVRTFEGIDLEFHAREADIKNLNKGKMMRNEVIRNAIERQGAILALMGQMEIQIGFLALKDSTSEEGKKALENLREMTEGLNQKLSKHEPILEILHEEFDKTAEARQHGKKIYT